MYVCTSCYREFNDKPNGRCPTCGSLVRKDFKRDDRKGNKNRKNFKNARKMKMGGEDWGI